MDLPYYDPKVTRQYDAERATWWLFVSREAEDEQSDIRLELSKLRSKRDWLQRDDPWSEELQAVCAKIKELEECLAVLVIIQRATRLVRERHVLSRGQVVKEVTRWN